MGGGRLRAGRERRSARRALWTVAACACAGMAGGLCSPDQFPQPPPFSEWDRSRSNPKCTSEGCVDFHFLGVCSDSGRGGVCPSETECSQGKDDESECFCRCCCQYKPADWQCEWSKKNAGQPIRTPGNLHPGEACTAVCQPGYAPKDPQAQSEKFTCSTATSRLEPPIQSTFECVEDKMPYCRTAPPCEVAGCEWADSCTEPGLRNHECKAQCQPGYVKPPGMPAEVGYVCKELQGTDSWDWQVAGGGSPLQCLRECPAYPPVQHQVFPSCVPPHTNCMATCESGYHWAGVPAAGCDNVAGVSYTCTDGEWQPNLPTECACAPNACPAAGDNKVVPGGSGCAAGVYSSNQTISGCEIECRDGYTKLSGSGGYRCNTEGNWVPTSNKLNKLVACGHPRSFGIAPVGARAAELRIAAQALDLTA